MKSSVLLASIGLLATVLGSPVLAGDHDGDRDRGPDRPHAANTSPDGILDHGMRAVPNRAGADEWGHGWQYFSDPAARRAVVISPQGDYYYSRGKGLRWVAAAQTGV